MVINKVIVHLSGGLGNQMFQYMAGAGLAKSSGRELVINLNWFLNPTFLHRNNPKYLTKRKIDILQFETVAKTKVDWLATPRNGRMERLVSLMNESRRVSLGVTTEFDFNDGVFETKKQTKRLFGFFMSPKFFLGLSPKQVFKDLNPSLSAWSNQLQDEIRSHNSIGVHIRLGDYVALGDKVIPAQDYFLSGIENIRSAMGANSKVFLFTDEPARLSALFPILASRGQIVSPPAYTTPAENLLLLSNCSAFVCSNSTFSWWGAALSDAQECRLVRPSYFYTAKPEVDVHSDLWAPTSIRLHPLSGAVA